LVVKNAKMSIKIKIGKIVIFLLKIRIVKNGKIIL